MFALVPGKRLRLQFFGKANNMNDVIDIAVPEFSFVASLPESRKTRLEVLKDVFGKIDRATREHGALVPPALVAGVLGVSRQRVMELVEAGRLVRVEIDGHPFITENSVVAHARDERKAGRPVKTRSLAGQIKLSVQLGREFANGVK